MVLKNRAALMVLLGVAAAQAAAALNAAPGAAAWAGVSRMRRL